MREKPNFQSVCYASFLQHCVLPIAFSGGVWPSRKCLRKTHSNEGRKAKPIVNQPCCQNEVNINGLIIKKRVWPLSTYFWTKYLKFLWKSLWIMFSQHRAHPLYVSHDYVPCVLHTKSHGITISILKCMIIGPAYICARKYVCSFRHTA